MKRFWSKVDKSGGPFSCWEWTAYCDSGGYGRCGFNGKVTTAHRIAWILTNGLIPEGMEIAHACNNKPCVNPAHLYLATPKQNTQDAVRDGLRAKGEQHSNAKLTEYQIGEIIVFQRAGWTQQEIGDHFGVGKSTICRILSGQSWKHLTGIKSWLPQPTIVKTLISNCD